MFSKGLHWLCETELIIKSVCVIPSSILLLWLFLLQGGKPLHPQQTQRPCRMLIVVPVCYSAALFMYLPLVYHRCSEFPSSLLAYTVQEGRSSVCFVHCYNPRTRHCFCHWKRSLNICGLIDLLFKVRAYILFISFPQFKNSARNRYQ